MTTCQLTAQNIISNLHCADRGLGVASACYNQLDQQPLFSPRASAPEWLQVPAGVPRCGPGSQLCMRGERGVLGIEREEELLMVRLVHSWLL